MTERAVILTSIPEGDDMTINQARALLDAELDEGTRCPCCDRFAMIYHRRTITGTMAAALIEILRAVDVGEFVHLPKLLGRQHADEAKLAYWGLIVEELRERADGGRAGYWAPTDLAIEFVYHGATVPKFAHTYNRKCLWVDGPPWSIVDALGTKFDLAELMHGMDRPTDDPYPDDGRLFP